MLHWFFVLLRVVACAGTATLLLLPGLAHAQDGPQSLDCDRPTSQRQTWVCSSPYLRDLAATVEQETQALLAASPMRATLRSEHEALVRSLYAYNSRLDPRETLATRLRAIRAAAASTDAALAARPTRQDLAKSCQSPPSPFFETALMRCRVERVTGAGPRIVAQFQRWTGPVDNDPALGPLTAVLLFAEVAGQAGEPARHRLVGWAAADDADLGAPVAVEGEGRNFVTLPRTNRGSAATTSDVVLIATSTDGEWRELNVSDWFTELQKRLPRGLIARSAFSLDLLGMRASTLLARDGDANCCPSGGTAELTFILRRDALVIDSLVLRRPQPMPLKGTARPQ